MKQERGSCEVVIESLWSGKRFKVKACEDYVLTISLTSAWNFIQIYTN